MAVSLPSGDPRGTEIVKALVEFEASVALAEPALVARDWQQLDELLCVQHRLTQALANALYETRDARPPAFSAEVDRRLALITERRGDQLRRLIAFNHLVKQRLTIISRAKEMRRTNVEKKPQPRILDLRQ